MNETFILHLPSQAVSHKPFSFDFVSFADAKFISDSSPVLTTTDESFTDYDKIYRTPDGKTYLKYIFNNQNDSSIDNEEYSSYRVFDDTLSLIDFINPPFEETESSIRKEEHTCYEHDNTSTEDILNWALNTYNYKNPNERIFSLEEAREMLFNGTISYYFDMVTDNDKSEIKEIPCIYIEGDNIWTKDLPNLTHTSSNISLTENTTIKHIGGIFDNIVTGDYLFYNTPNLESICSNTFPKLQSGRYMFASCPSIVSFHIPSAPQHSDYMFSDCTSLSQLNFENFNPDTFSGIFNNTPKLTLIDFGNTSIDKISSISPEDIASVSDLSLITEENDEELLENLFNSYGNLVNLNITMSPFPFKNANTESLTISKTNNTITYKFQDIDKNVNIISTSIFKTDMSEFFKDSPLTSLTVNTPLEELTMAKNSFSSSLFSVDSVQNIYDAIPEYNVDDYRNHIITIGINIEPEEFLSKKNPFANLCGEFVQWNNDTEMPVYETNVSSGVIDNISGEKLYNENCCRDSEFEDQPHSEVQYVSWINKVDTTPETPNEQTPQNTEEDNQSNYEQADVYTTSNTPLIYELKDKDEKISYLMVSFSNFRCLYNTYETVSIDPQEENTEEDTNDSPSESTTPSEDTEPSEDEGIESLAEEDEDMPNMEDIPEQPNESFTITKTKLHNACLAGAEDDTLLDAYYGDKEKVYVQIIKPSDTNLLPKLPDPFDNLFKITNYTQKEGDTVIFAGQLSELPQPEDTIVLDKSTLYQYYIEKKSEVIKLPVTPLGGKTGNFLFYILNKGYMRGDNYNETFNLGTITESVDKIIVLQNIILSSNDGKSLGFITDSTPEYTWNIVPEKTEDGNLKFIIDEPQNFGISWQIIKEEIETEEGTEIVEHIVHQDIDVSNTSIEIIYDQEEGTTITFRIPNSQDVIVVFPNNYFAPYDFLISDDFVNLTTPSNPSIKSIKDCTLTDSSNINEYTFSKLISEDKERSVMVKVSLLDIFPENSFLYNSGFIYENFISDEDFFPVIMLQNDKFREKGWKLDLRFKTTEPLTGEDTP